MTKQATKSIRCDELTPGQIVIFFSTAHLIAEIVPYDGPLSDVIFAHAVAADGWSIGLSRGASQRIDIAA